jgi:hypothetical protein
MQDADGQLLLEFPDCEMVQVAGQHSPPLITTHSNYINTEAPANLLPLSPPAALFAVVHAAVLQVMIAKDTLVGLRSALLEFAPIS